MSLRLDLETLRTLHALRFEGSDAALARAVSDILKRPVNRSTVYRWVREGRQPKNATRLLALSSALEADPIAVIDLRQALLLGALGLARNLRLWEGLLLRYAFADEEWPPREPVERVYGRGWTIAEFGHRPKEHGTGYRRLRLVRSSHRRTRGVAPLQAWHFAYRDALKSGPGRWMPYGVVFASSTEARLLAFNGLEDHASLNGLQAPVLVQTHFGAGAADFRVASLHEFELKEEGFVRDLSPPHGVRFGYPQG